MSEKAIFDYLRQGGLSTAGACAVMGNMYCESLLKSDNVQDGMGYTDEAYTNVVDNGTINRSSFALDSRGYGLCQWTFYTRKQELWNMTVGNGYSIADERLQCKLCVTELQRDYNGLYGYLCSSDCDLAAATRRVCSEYERPAVNNYSARIDAACRYYNKFHDVEPDVPDEPDDDPADGDVIHPEIHRACFHLEYGDGCTARGQEPSPQVKVWQWFLTCWGFDIGADGVDGQFGKNTKDATEKWQERVRSLGGDVEVNGVVDSDDWEEVIFVPVE